MPRPFSSFGLSAASSAENLRVRRLQVGFLLLLAITAVQVVWWLVDQARIADRIAEDRVARLEVDRTAAEASLLAGQPSDELRDLYPDLLIGAEGARIRPDALQEIEAERGSHLSQYRWEGAFFLLVLAGGILVLWRVLHREADLLNRQQNFLAAVSHELRSPLASLRLTTETLLLRDLAATDRRGLLERNLEDLRRLERLVGNLLETTRLEERRAVPRREPVDLSEAVSLAFAELGHRVHGAEGIDIEVEVESGLGLRADPVGLGTVLRNLIGNAIESAQTAGSRVEVTARRLGSAVELLVLDDGVGFEPAESQRLFEKFYRPGSELRRNKQGSGLGLYLVRGFVALEGGEVEASSEGPGRGATFRVTWPARESAEERAS
ncbi:MAG: ATP-binding protein [Acidobacteria bacterium]|nr:ATP-binding protein [Acidobacteriota bacterium]